MTKQIFEGYQLSPQQKHLWSLQAGGNDHPYRTECVFFIEGDITLAILREALEDVANRHEILRTTFQCLPDMTFPLQVITRSQVLWKDDEDISGWDFQSQSSRVGMLFEEMRQAPFDLRNGPLMISSLVILSPRKHALLVTLPALCADASSLRVLAGDILRSYAAISSGESVTDDAVQYADVSEVLNELLESEETGIGRTYWRKKDFSDASAFRLPFEKHIAQTPPFVPASLSSTLDCSTVKNIESLIRKYDCSVDVFLLACWQTLLWRLTGESNVCVGVAYDGRSYEELREALGLFAKYLPICGQVKENTVFADILKQANESASDARKWQDFFSWGVNRNSKQASPDTHFFPFCFDYYKQLPEHSMAGVSFSISSLRSCVDRFKIKLTCAHTKDILNLYFEYDSALFSAKDINRLAGYFRTLIISAVERPQAAAHDLEILNTAERQKLLIEFNATRAEYPGLKCAHQLFEEQAERKPSSIAVMFDDRQLTYEQLNRRANKIAHHLRSFGIGPEDLVAIFMDRSPDMVAALLGVFKAGGAYLPMDPAYPKERLAFMLDDARASVVLTQQHLVERLPNHNAQAICLDTQWETIASASEANPAAGDLKDNLAYVIYTSGSTGKPKGVMISHKGLANYLIWAGETYAASEGRGAPVHSSIGFDLTITSLFVPLLAGGRVELLSESEGIDSLRVALRSADNYSLLKMTPAHVDALSQLLTPSEVVDRANVLVIGGEALLGETVRWWRTHAPRTRIINEYGPTETVVGCCVFEVPAEAHLSGPMPIGRPIANTQIYLLDRHFKPVPEGVAGELCIGGDGLARGYLNQPALTAEKFVPNFFAEGRGALLYKTGDLARFGADGNIEFLGRNDQQVKIRGYRIELGEIEAVLSQHLSVRESVVTVREDIPGNKQVVAYIVPNPERAYAIPVTAKGEADTKAETAGVWRNRQALINDVRSFLRDRLPVYMTPSAIALLEEMPLTSHGKVDYSSLPEPGLAEGRWKKSFIEPRTPEEQIIANIWAEVLQTERVGVYDNFFEVGGHSLMATQIISRLRDAFQVDISFVNFFQSPTVTGLAEIIIQARDKQKESRSDIITRVKRSDEAGKPIHYPLSFAQERLWFIEQLMPDSDAYNFGAPLRLGGLLNEAALERSFDEVIRRHEILRTSFPLIEGRPAQVIAAAKPMRIPVIDLAWLPEADREMRAQLMAVEEIARPFDLAQGPLLRVSLLRLSDDDHVALIVMHHILIDGWSIGVLISELTSLYESYSTNRPINLPDLPIQYADFAIWQRNRLQGEVLDRQLSYWKEQFEGAPVFLDLPTDLPRPSVQVFRGATHPMAISEAMTKSLNALSQQEGVTLFMLLLAAFNTLLYRYSGQEDIVVGTPIANRNRTETEGLIGFFVNTLALRTDLSGEPSFKELVRRVREITLGAYAHQDMPFEKLVEEVQPERSLSHNPLFQVMFILQNAPMQAVELPNMTLKPLAVDNDTVRFDLVLNVIETDEGLRAALSYNTNLFEANSISRMADRFQRLLESIVENPQSRICDLPLLSAQELHQIRFSFNDTRRDFPRHLCIHELFEAQAERSPEAVAVVCQSQSLTYRQLNERANRLAHYLKSRGAGPEKIVAICLERGLDLVVAVMAALKSSSAYLPLDPSYPQERLKLMVDDSDALLIVTRSELADRLEGSNAELVLIDEQREQISQHSEQNPTAEAKPENLAYLIYTSGSTGKPKAVMVEHRNLVNTISCSAEEFGFREGEQMASLASYSFDIWLFEVMTPLVSGASVRVVRSEELLEEEKLSEELKKVSMVHGVPSLMRQVVRYAKQVEERGGMCEKMYEKVKRVFVGGDKVGRELVEEMKEVFEAAEIVELYGPTEGTIISTSRREQEEVSKAEGERKIEGERKGRIGRPLSNVKISIRDKTGAEVGMGMRGEIWIAGEGVSRGYKGAEELTSKKYVTEAGERYYKSGDEGRWMEGGEIEYIGRVDEQVKIRGYRVEIGEVEAAMREVEGVREAAVVVREEEGGEKRLIGYAQMEEGEEEAAKRIRKEMSVRMPEYMVPSVIKRVEEMPMSRNGKIDRGKLRDAEGERPELEEEYVAPRTALEQYLAKTWKDILGIENIGIHDNFFELGGDSIKAVLTTNKLQESLEEMVYVVSLFEAPTIEKLAAYLKEHYPTAISKIFGDELADSSRALKSAIRIGQSKKVDATMLEEARRLITPLAPRPHSAKRASRKNPQAIFILSPPRSGSTLLRVMLAGHSKLFAPPELELLSFNTLLDRKAEFGERYRIWMEGTIRALMEIRGYEAEEAKREMERYEQEQMSVKEFYRVMQEAIGSKRLVDKTPSYAQDIEVLRRAEEDFEDALYIHLLRHPRAMIRSFEEAKLDRVFFVRYKHEFATRELAELMWLISQQNIVEFLKQVPEERQHRVRFEELVKQPKEALGRVCEFLGIGFEPEMIQPYQNDRKKMTDGIHPLSKMVGDVRFHEHREIDARVADRWTQQNDEDFLGEMTWAMAEELGYPRVAAQADARKEAGSIPARKELSSIPLIDRGNRELEQLLAEISLLSPGEAQAMLAQETQPKDEIDSNS